MQHDWWEQGGREATKQRVWGIKSQMFRNLSQHKQVSWPRAELSSPTTDTPNFHCATFNMFAELIIHLNIFLIFLNIISAFLKAGKGT